MLFYVSPFTAYSDNFVITEVFQVFSVTAVTMLIIKKNHGDVWLVVYTRHMTNDGVNRRGLLTQFLRDLIILYSTVTSE